MRSLIERLCELFGQAQGHLALHGHKIPKPGHVGPPWSHQNDSPAALPNMATGGKAYRSRSSPTSTHPDWPRVSLCLKDNYCVNAPIETRRLTGSEKTVNLYQCPERQ